MRSIVVKLWLGMIALVAIMFFLLWVFQIQYLEKFYINQQIEHVKSRVNEFAHRIDISNPKSVSADLESLSLELKARTDLFNLNKNIILTTGQIPRMGMHISDEDMQKVLSGQILIDKRVHPRFQNLFLYVGVPIIKNYSIKGGMVVSFPVAPIEETTNILKIQLIIISLIIFLASTLLAYFISKGFTKPIIKINNAAIEMANGNLNISLEINSRDEFGTLGRTINNLAYQLSKIEQLRKELIANISHEFRTPLSLIRGYAETIRDVTGDNKEKRDKQIGIVIEESERLTRMVNDVLNLAQIQSGYLNLNKRQFEIDEIIDGVLKRFSYIEQIANVNINFQKKIQQKYSVYADLDRIEQVLYNLINNAVNHSEQGSKVIVKLDKFNDKIKIEIIDSGKGIPQEQLPFIWDRFFKGEERNKGTGLGLAIVKGILTSHKAEFGVESKESQGTTFWFKIDAE